MISALKRMSKRLVYTSGLAFCVSVTVPPTSFSEIYSPTTDQMLNDYDWILDCDMQVLDDYLKYPGSLAPGLVLFNVTYRVSPNTSLARQKSSPPGLHEQLWYQNGKCIGLRRINEISARKGFQGAIIFRSNKPSLLAGHTLEIANATTRLLVEAKLQPSDVSGVFVPADCFDRVSWDLARFNFLPIEKVAPTGEERLSLHLNSYPEFKNHYFFYN